ncbi:MAG TPA: hypothetical protein VM600_03795 [Actinomycetota bacterium]|nr:hypothetical protein [Actinomycetota bacterium]
MGKGRPQQQEINRSGHTPVDPDHREEVAANGLPDPKTKGDVPPENRPGHHPDKEQDQPQEMGGAGHGTG